MAKKVEKTNVKKSAAKHTAEGYEIGNPTPMQPPMGYKRTPSLAEQIAQQVRLQRLDDLKMEETEEEADDFDVGEDFEPLSPYENDHMPTLANLKKQAKEINAKLEEEKRKKAIADYEKEHGAKRRVKDTKETEAPSEEGSRSPEPAP